MHTLFIYLSQVATPQTYCNGRSLFIKIAENVNEVYLSPQLLAMISENITWERSRGPSGLEVLTTRESLENVIKALEMEFKPENISLCDIDALG